MITTSEPGSHILRSGFRDFAAHLIRPPLFEQSKGRWTAHAMKKKGLSGTALRSHVFRICRTASAREISLASGCIESQLYTNTGPTHRAVFAPFQPVRTVSHQHLRFQANACYNALKRNVQANVAELADAPDLGSGSRKGMGVRPSPFAPQNKKLTPLLSKVLTVRVNGLVVNSAMMLRGADTRKKVMDRAKRRIRPAAVQFLDSDAEP